MVRGKQENSEEESGLEQGQGVGDKALRQIR